MIKFFILFLFVFPTLCSAESLHDVDYDTVELAEIKRLVETKAANVNEPDQENHTPLMKAIASDRKQIADYLFEKGARIDDQDNRGNSVILATEKKAENSDEYTLLPTDYIEKIKYFVSKKANVNTQNNLGDTMLTIGNKTAETYQYLIDVGASIEQGGRNGISPLMYTIYLNNFDAFMVILKQADKTNPERIINHKDDSKDSAIHYVGRYCSDSKFGKELFKRKVNVTTKSSKGMSLLGEILMAKCPVSLFEEYVKILDENGYSLSKEKALQEKKRFIDESMTLHEAISLGNTPFVKAFLEHGTSLMPTYPDGRTPLMVTIDKNNPELFEVLFPYDKDNKTKDRSGRTAFKHAEQLNRIEFLNKFISSGIEK
ncbi:MAG: ankyrin repeat domain-containing protein [Alphaproteobacteria bacterium]|nr:ankyrin repeat domain-containing protein [Alphaproteobacteria bacterium]